MGSLSEEPGSVGLAIAARREVFDPRGKLKSRRALSWIMLGTGYSLIGASVMLIPVLTFVQSLLLLVPGIALIAKGFGRVDHALADLRRYDAHVKPLPQAKLRLVAKPPE